MPEAKLSARTLRTIEALRKGSTEAVKGKDEEVQDLVLVNVKATDVLRLVRAIDVLSGTVETETDADHE